MKKILVFLFVLLCVYTFNSVAEAKIRIYYSGTALPSPDKENLKALVADELNNYINDQSDLGKGFATANAYASRTTDLNGYIGYDVAAVMFGVAAGVQLPVSKISEIGVVVTDIADRLDSYIGGGVGGAINVGLNAGRFGLKLLNRDIYLNLKFFYLSQKISMFDTTFCTFGIGANWQWIKPRVFKSKFLMKWRGISVGTGLFYNQNSIDAKFDVLSGMGAGLLTLQKGLNFGLVSNVVNIPFELLTSVQFLWFLTINAGIGLDFNIGQNDIIVKTGGNIVYNNKVDSGARMVIDASTLGNWASAVDMKFMLGAGLNIGPGVLCHVDFSYYLLHGFGMSISSGMAW